MAKRRKPTLGGLPGYLVLLVLLLVWLFQELRPALPPPEERGPLEVFFMPEEGERAKAQLIGLLEGAQEEALGAFYEFRDLEIARALLSAKGRGVAVRIYGESDHREDFRRYLVAARLGQTQEPPRVTRSLLQTHLRPLGGDCEEIAGIPVCFDEREGFMHHKVLVVDRKAVFTGSTNMTWNAFARNNENSLLLASPTLAEGYRREVLALLEGRKEGLGEPVAFRLEGGEGPLEGTAYFSPAGGERAWRAILERIRSARKEILVAAFVLTDEEILKALAEAKARGVRVQVLLETRNLDSSREETLLRAGIPVRRDGNPYTLHHKVMVVDGLWVITGSYNFSYRARAVNNENLLVLKGEALAERYRKEVERLWEAGSTLGLP
ncbi:phospholipase D-like domain-containing protein [Thermus oshimai]|jgi:phosphatidylserine/phosphatidylglycerophosphate/cardiolipin synthase-like enzyme